MALKDLNQWKEKFAKRTRVQPEEHDKAVDGGFLSGESALVVSGPPEFDNEQPADLIPVGLVQNAQVSQNKQLNQLYEIGGRDPFFIPGRVQTRASLSRILFDGPSLFYALYQRSFGEEEQIPSPANFGGEQSYPQNNPTMPYGGSGNTISEDGQLMDTIRETNNEIEQSESDPGLFWTNLSSAIFNKPLGLGFVLYDMEGEPYGGTYIENAYITSHRFGISSNQTVLAENVSLSGTRIRPLSAASIPG